MAIGSSSTARTAIIVVVVIVIVLVVGVIGYLFIRQPQATLTAPSPSTPSEARIVSFTQQDTQVTAATLPEDLLTFEVAIENPGTANATNLTLSGNFSQGSAFNNLDVQVPSTGVSFTDNSNASSAILQLEDLIVPPTTTSAPATITFTMNIVSGAEARDYTLSVELFGAGYTSSPVNVSNDNLGSHFPRFDVHGSGVTHATWVWTDYDALTSGAGVDKAGFTFKDAADSMGIGDSQSIPSTIADGVMGLYYKSGSYAQGAWNFAATAEKIPGSGTYLPTGALYDTFLDGNDDLHVVWPGYTIANADNQKTRSITYYIGYAHRTAAGVWVGIDGTALTSASTIADSYILSSVEQAYTAPSLRIDGDTLEMAYGYFVPGGSVVQNGIKYQEFDLTNGVMTLGSTASYTEATSIEKENTSVFQTAVTINPTTGEPQIFYFQTENADNFSLLYNPGVGKLRTFPKGTNSYFAHVDISTEVFGGFDVTQADITGGIHVSYLERQANVTGSKGTRPIVEYETQPFYQVLAPGASSWRGYNTNPARNRDAVYPLPEITANAFNAAIAGTSIALDSDGKPHMTHGVARGSIDDFNSGESKPTDSTVAPSDITKEGGDITLNAAIVNFGLRLYQTQPGSVGVHNPADPTVQWPSVGVQIQDNIRTFLMAGVIHDTRIYNDELQTLFVNTNRTIDPKTDNLLTYLGATDIYKLPSVVASASLGQAATTVVIKPAQGVGQAVSAKAVRNDDAESPRFATTASAVAGDDVTYLLSLEAAGGEAAGSFFESADSMDVLAEYLSFGDKVSVYSSLDDSYDDTDILVESLAYTAGDKIQSKEYSISSGTFYFMVIPAVVKVETDWPANSNNAVSLANVFGNTATLTLEASVEPGKESKDPKKPIEPIDPVNPKQPIEPKKPVTPMPSSISSSVPSGEITGKAATGPAETFAVVIALLLSISVVYAVYTLKAAKPQSEVNGGQSGAKHTKK